MTATLMPAPALVDAPAPPPSSAWTAPADRAAAETAIRTLYAAANLPAPSIVWSASPLALAREWKLRRHRVGHCVRAAVFDAPAHRIIGLLRRAEGGPLARPRNALSELTAQLAHEGQKTRVGPWARLRILPILMHSLTRRRTWQSFRAVSVSPYDYAWLLHAHLEDRLANADARICAALASLVRHAGWLVPYETQCWISERPATLALDDGGRLHRKDGPALAYADGFRRYAWKGIEVPSAFVRNPERITLNAIDSQTDIFVRRCLIEMITPKRFIHMGGADLVMSDGTGTLWRRSWPRGDAWAAVEVVNGTPGPDGQLDRYVLQVPPELESARAAVAWTYGMTEQHYRNLVLRT